MDRNRKWNKNKEHGYNLEKLDAIITVALITTQDSICVPKRLYKTAKQLLAIKGLIGKIKIKTY